jgi:hypothetical protein
MERKRKRLIILILTSTLCVYFVCQLQDDQINNCVENPLKKRLLVEAETVLYCDILRSNCSSKTNYKEYYSEQFTQERISSCSHDDSYFKTFPTIAFQEGVSLVFVR